MADLAEMLCWWIFSYETRSNKNPKFYYGPFIAFYEEQETWTIPKRSGSTWSGHIYGTDRTELCTYAKLNCLK